MTSSPVVIAARDLDLSSTTGLLPATMHVAIMAKQDNKIPQRLQARTKWLSFRIFKCIFFQENIFIFIQIKLNLLPIVSKSALVQVMAWWHLISMA